MSYQGEDSEPPSKKQKFGEGPSPLFAFGGPVEDEATARRKLVEAEFDPDAPVDQFGQPIEFTLGDCAPMIYFCHEGDLKMCRYLLSRGASTTKTCETGFYCPMYAAAQEGHIKVCQFLFENGAKHDVRRENGQGWTPFAVAAVQKRDEVVRWLALNGALCADDNSDVEGHRIYPKNKSSDMRYWSKNDADKTCSRLVEWATDVTRTLSSLVTFLHGTLPGNGRQCTPQCLSGHPGIRKHVADCVGLEVTQKRHLHILRQVKDVLPSFINR